MSAAPDAGSRRAEAAVAMTGGLGSLLYSTEQLRAFSEPVSSGTEPPNPASLQPEPHAQPAESEVPLLVSAAGEFAADDTLTAAADTSITAQLPIIGDGLDIGDLISGLLDSPAIPTAASVSSAGSVSVDASPQFSLLDGPNVLNSLTSTLSIGDGDSAPANLTHLLGGLDLNGLTSGGLGSLTAPVQAVLSDTLHVVVDLVSGVTDIVGSLLSATSLTAPVGQLVANLGDVVGDTLHGLLGAGGDAGLLDGLFSGLLASDDGGGSGGLLNGLPLVGDLLGSAGGGPDSLVGDVLGLTLMGEGDAPAPLDPVHQVFDVVGDLTGLLDLSSILDQPHGLHGGSGHIP